MLYRLQRQERTFPFRLLSAGVHSESPAESVCRKMNGQPVHTPEAFPQQDMHSLRIQKYTVPPHKLSVYTGSGFSLFFFFGRTAFPVSEVPDIICKNSLSAKFGVFPLRCAGIINT